jgi:hypothetical protein
MKIAKRDVKKLITAVTTISLLMAGCASIKKPEGADNVRNKLTQLQADPQLSSRAPVAINAAEEAMRTAEQPQKDKVLAAHLVWIADRKVDIATAQAQSRMLEDQRKTFGEQTQAARLDARTQEANNARMDAQTSKQQADDLQRQMAELNAKTTERGMVVTLGDLLFATGKSDLKGGTANHLGKLSAFLNQYPERTVIIEGHTDSVGSDDSNFSLSQRRADAVKSYLVREGIASSRIDASGKGENDPIASNDSNTGRQQNRRVEVIIANPTPTAHQE